jgi:hypothetical protein
VPSFLQALAFVSTYAAGRDVFVVAARELEQILAKALSGVGVPIHLVTARAKAVDSL